MSPRQCRVPTQNNIVEDMVMSPRQCRVPTQNNIVGTRHCLGLYHSHATGIDITSCIDRTNLSLLVGVFLPNSVATSLVRFPCACSPRG
jgi:hypothetical protein